MKLFESFKLFIRWKLIRGDKIKKAYDKRCSDIVARILELREDPMEPWVVNGRWSWNVVEGVAYPVTLVLPERPLVICANGPEIGNWNESGRYCLDRKTWERANRVMAHLKITCEKMNLRLITIEWDEPISSEVLSIKLKGEENG